LRESAFPDRADVVSDPTEVIVDAADKITWLENGLKKQITQRRKGAKKIVPSGLPQLSLWNFRLSYPSV